MADLRVFFGHHKCGSRFFRSNVLRAAADQAGWEVVSYRVPNPPFHFRRLDELDLHGIDYAGVRERTECLVNLSNASARVHDAVRSIDRPLRGIRIFRDPRQILVSSYYHHLEGHDLCSSGWVWDKLCEDRTILRRLSLSDGLYYELNNITRELLDTQIFGWQSAADVLDIKLEEFAEQPAAWRSRIAAHLEVEPAWLGVQENRTANPAGKRWQDVFDERLSRVFKERYGAGLVRLGYAADVGW